MEIIKKKIKFFLFTVIIFLAAIGVYFVLNKLICQKLTCLSLKDNNQYKIKSVYEDNKYIFRGLYENGNNLLKIEIRQNSTVEEANLAIQTQITRTKGLFEDAAAPYPGEISDVIACGNEYKPVYSSKKQNGIDISYFEGYVNDRLVFGSCADDQAAYHDTLAMFYCAKQNKFYQLEIIIPRKDYVEYPKENEKILNSIGCR